MKKLRRIYSKIHESKTPLLEHGSLPTGSDQPPAQDALVGHEVQSDTEIQELTRSFEDGSRMIEEMAQSLPKPPAAPSECLHQYLTSLQHSVTTDLDRLGPHLKGQGLTLVERYHCHMFSLLDDLLQKINDTRSLFILIKWVLQSYLRVTDATKNMDLLLLSDWLTDAKSKLLQSVKDEFRASAEKILELDRAHLDHDDEEACIQFYVDIIQFTEAMPTTAQQVSSALAAEVRQLCYQELLRFLRRYADEQTETLKKKTKMDQTDMICFLKTLKTCTEIKQHVRTNRTKTKDVTRNIIEVLEHMEAFALTCVKKITTNTAEGLLKTYFTAKNKQFFQLIHHLQTSLPKKKWCQDEMENVAVEVYKVVAHVYVKQLVKVRPKKLAKRWSPDAGQTVAEDAEILHNTFSEMVPGVEPLNQILLKTAELLECDYPDTVLLITTCMYKECGILRDDLDLQVALLQWKGIPERKARQVLEDICEQHKSKVTLWNCCLPFCTRPKK